MKIVYYSSLFFTDCDFPLIKQYQQKGVDTLYFIEAVSDRFAGGLFNIRSSLPKHGFVNVQDIDEFKPYDGYIDLSKVYLVIRTSKLYDPINWVLYIKLCWLIAKYRATTLHITQALGISEALLYMFCKKMVLTVHDPILHSGEYSKTAEIKRKVAFKLIPKLVLLNRSQEILFQEKYGVKRGVFFNKLGVYDCLKCLQIEKRKSIYGKYLLFFGHFSPYKGIDVLCEAMMLVNKKVKDIKCIIAGKGKLDFDISKYEDNNQIIVINNFIETEELVSLIDNSEFVVCPYKDATQSGVVSSAFALDKPVVATNVGGLAETVIDGLTGKIVTPNNPIELAEVILSLFQNPEQISQFRNNIKEKNAKGIDSWNCISNNFLQIYEC